MLVSLTLLAAAALNAVPAPAAPAGAPADDAAWNGAVERAALNYQRDFDAATKELVDVRARIAQERLPLAQSQQDWQNKILTGETALHRLQIKSDNAAAHIAALKTEVDGLNRNLAYLTSMGRDALAGLKDGLLPGESGAVTDSIAALEFRLRNPANEHDVSLTAETADLVMQRLRNMIGGHLAKGSSLLEGSNELTPGQFLWSGPEVYFRADRAGAIGTVRTTENVPYPITHLLALEDPTAADALFRGEPGAIAVDPSGGKAIRLQEVRGTWVDHVKKGGVIGYIIIGLGGLAVITTLFKLSDIGRNAVDGPRKIQAVFELVAAGSIAEAERTVAGLRRTGRELLSGGLKHLDKPKVALEDHLYATLLRLRMELERRLPFLAVIVAAAPLLGLLGTVTGMVKTFTLINVFGTGNASKLSSGISEALVTTELGLMVAIPTLVVHGYLNRRTQRNLSLMERYAAEFVAVAAERNNPTDVVTEPLS